MSNQVYSGHLIWPFNFLSVPILILCPSMNRPFGSFKRPFNFQIAFAQAFGFVFISQILFLSGLQLFYFNFRHISQMCQGVFTQCRGVAHVSHFSFQFFSISILAPMGPSFHPNSHAIWGTFHPIYLLLMYGALTIPYIINGASYPPIFGCFSLHITSPITQGCIHSHREFFSACFNTQ